MTPRLFSLALCSALIAGAGSVRMTGVTVEGANGAAWETVVIPGGFAGARRGAGMQGTAEDWRTVPLLIELSYRGVEGLRITRQLDAYAASLRTVRSLAQAISPDRRITLEKGSAQRAEFDRLLDALGLEYAGDRRSVRLDPAPDAQERIEILDAAGLPMRDIVERLNAGGTVSLDTRDGVAPLPLGAAFWERRFEPAPPPHDLLWAILASREMASLYYGLLGFDGATLRAVAADGKLESAVVQHALILPTIAPTLRIEDGRVQTPGGRDAVHLWQELVGKSVDRPAEFVKALLGRDEGALAYFYGSVGALPADSAAWVMTPAGDGHTRRKAFRRLYEAFRSALGDWRPNALLQPPRHTPAHVLFTLTTTEGGTLAGPAWPEFLGPALESDEWPIDPGRELGAIEEGRVANAAEILELVCPRACDPDRLGTLVLLQREFPTAPPAEASRLLSAARTRARYPALALEIERMKLNDAEVYRQLGGVAAKIETLESSVEAVALLQFQAAISMLARVRALGAPPEWVRERIASLAALRLGGAGFDGGLLRWLDSGLLATSDGEPSHEAALSVLSGHPWHKPGATFEWEGLRYRVDIAARERERIEEVRGSFAGNSLTSAIGLLRLADGVPEAATSGRLEALETTLKGITDNLDDVGRVAWAGAPSTFDDDIRNLSKEVMAVLRRGNAQDPGRTQRAARLLRNAADIVGADALIALVYASSLQDPNSPLAMSGELPRRHHLRPAPGSAQKWNPWSLPFERHPDGGARHVAGALLGLDAGVPQFFVRRIGTRRPQQEPNLGLTIADGLWRTASLAAPWKVSDEEIAALADAVKRGAAVAEGWSREIDERTFDTLGIAGPRAGWLRWSAVRGAIDREVLRLEDLVRLGSETHDPAYRWGAARDLSSCLCVGMPRVAGEMRGPAGDVDAVALTIVEPSLRVAQELRMRGIPAALAPGVLMLFTTELIDHALVPHPVDVGAVISLVRQVPSRRFDDYVAAVAARGPLVAIQEVER